MIDIEKLTDSDVGRRVVYQYHNDKDVGFLYSWNKTSILVQFKGQYTEACYPEHVSFEFEGNT